MSSKGQFFSYDAIISSSIFLITLALLLSYWQATERAMETDFGGESLRLSGTLLSPGYPEGWEETGNPEMVGISEKNSPGKISLPKLAKLRELSDARYEDVKSLLLVETDYWIELSGAELDCGGPCFFGKRPPENAYVYPTTRLVALNGKPASLRVVLWKAD
ncbi:MAG: hypothetical protein ABIF01_01160 [Candidatus Micrarchaeota archaeon]